MTAFENNNYSFKNALESGLPQSPKFLDEAMQIHMSRDIKATENQIAADYPNNMYDTMRVHLALLGAANSDVAKVNPQLQASIYRDLAVQEQGMAVAKMRGADFASAGLLLNGSKDDPHTAENFIAKAESLDPDNKDLKQLHTIQDQLTAQVKSIEKVHSTVGQLDTDALATGVAIGIHDSWEKAMKGSVQAAAEVQHFVDRAAASGETEILAKVYQKLDPHLAAQLRKAVQNYGSVVTFE